MKTYLNRFNTSKGVKINIEIHVTTEAMSCTLLSLWK